MCKFDFFGWGIIYIDNKVFINYILIVIWLINIVGEEMKRNWLLVFYIFNICRKKVRIYIVCCSKRFMLFFNSWFIVLVKFGFFLGLNKGYEKLYCEDIIIVEKLLL